MVCVTGWRKPAHCSWGIFTRLLLALNQAINLTMPQSTWSQSLCPPKPKRKEGNSKHLLWLPMSCQCNQGEPFSSTHVDFAKLKKVSVDSNKDGRKKLSSLVGGKTRPAWPIFLERSVLLHVVCGNVNSSCLQRTLGLLCLQKDTVPEVGRDPLTSLIH